jgi:hypothetical protein
MVDKPQGRVAAENKIEEGAKEEGAKEDAVEEFKQQFALIQINIISENTQLNNNILSKKHLPELALEIMNNLNKTHEDTTKTGLTPQYDSLLAEIKKQRVKRDKYSDETKIAIERDIYDGVSVKGATTLPKIMTQVKGHTNWEKWEPPLTAAVKSLEEEEEGKLSS